MRLPLPRGSLNFVESGYTYRTFDNGSTVVYVGGTSQVEHQPPKKLPDE